MKTLVRLFVPSLALLSVFLLLAPAPPECTPVPVEPTAECVDAADCGDGDPCTVDTCDPAVGCSHRLTENCAGLHDERCHDAVDNDQDGLVDFEDPDCATVPCCPVEHCANGVDDDWDGLTDCADTDCIDDGWCTCGGDSDCDGVPDAEDNCPLVLNPHQRDFDADALGDACDLDDDGD